MVYPGSSEIWKTSELEDYEEHGKGFVVVDLDGQKPIIKRVKVDIPRKFIKEKIDYPNLESEILSIKDSIKDLDKKPILNLIINNVESDTRGIYDLIKDELGDLALMIRPTFNMAGQDPVPREVGANVGPEKLIATQLEEYQNAEVETLGTDLYRLLSKDKTDEAREIIDQFYHDHYASGTEEVESVDDVDEEASEEGDVQTTLMED